MKSADERVAGWTKIQAITTAILGAATIGVLIYHGCMFSKQGDWLRQQTALIKFDSTSIVNRDKPFVEIDSEHIEGLDRQGMKIFSIYFKNYGTTQAYFFKYRTGISFKDSVGKELFRGHGWYNAGNLEPNRYEISSGFIGVTPERVRGIKNGDVIVYFFGDYRYSDWKGIDTTISYCFYYNPFAKYPPFSKTFITCENTDDYENNSRPYFAERGAESSVK